MSVVADSDGPGGEGVCRSLRLMGHDPTIRPAISFGWLDGFPRMVTNHTGREHHRRRIALRAPLM
jgi:hypothetical protein